MPSQLNVMTTNTHTIRYTPAYIQRGTIWQLVIILYSSTIMTGAWRSDSSRSTRTRDSLTPMNLTYSPSPAQALNNWRSSYLYTSFRCHAMTESGPLFLGHVVTAHALTISNKAPVSDFRQIRDSLSPATMLFLSGSKLLAPPSPSLSNPHSRARIAPPPLPSLGATHVLSTIRSSHAFLVVKVRANTSCLRLFPSSELILHQETY